MINFEKMNERSKLYKNLRIDVVKKHLTYGLLDI